MKTFTLWLVVITQLVSVCFAVPGNPSYVIGRFKSSSRYVFLKRDNDNFDYGAVVQHFNTCHRYKFLIDKIVVTTTDGGSDYPARGHLVAGGLNSFFFGLRLTGAGTTFYAVEVWVTWQEKARTVTQDTMVSFRLFHPCAHPASEDE
ncbi:uncharacterized protein LOC124366768 [Homalodisca vitripennis]|uniref:uncharacterized protein LOC124366768 n=1 Tax=Homalodisca vitripennis TaxID=197043 RepID=UPI001EEA9403|nr:uncharacterized protein LOC124366768 [Homalodisca vitripennis]